MAGMRMHSSEDLLLHTKFDPAVFKQHLQYHKAGELDFAGQGDYMHFLRGTLGDSQRAPNSAVLAEFKCLPLAVHLAAMEARS